MCSYTAGYSEQGAAAYLDTGIGSRAAAMGSAFVALGGTPDNIYWNAAGISRVGSHSVSMMSSMSGESRKLNYISYVFPFTIRPKDDFVGFGEKKNPVNAGIGIGWISYGVSGLEGRDTYGNPTEDFSDSENAIMLAYGQSLGYKLSLGVNLKYLMHHLTDYASAGGFAADLGIMYRISDIFTAGLNVQNMVGSMKWKIKDDVLNEEFEYNEKVLLNMKTGISAEIVKDKLVSVLDIDKTLEQKIRFHTGLEYMLRQNAAVRFGIDDMKITSGFGWRRNRMLLDYAFIYERFGWDIVHRFSLGLSFGAEREDMDIPAKPVRNQALRNMKKSKKRKKKMPEMKLKGRF